MTTSSTTTAPEPRWYRLRGKLVLLTHRPDEGRYYCRIADPLSTKGPQPQPITVCFWCCCYLAEGHGEDALCAACEAKRVASCKFFGECVACNLRLADCSCEAQA